MTNGGWPAAVTLTRAAGGHSGAWAAQLTNTGTSVANCVLSDSPHWVTRTAAGLYTASLWVRSDTPGTTLSLELSEQAGGVAGKSQITLTSAWQQVSVSYAPYAPGATTLEFRAVTNSPPGTCFYADDAAIVFHPGPTASLTVTPMTGVAPLLVRADASASTATELPIASYSFNFGDGSEPVGPQTGATAEHSYAAAGTYLVRVTVTDTRGGTSYASRSWITVAAGIIANPSFESGTSGWNSSGSSAGVTLTPAWAGPIAAPMARYSRTTARRLRPAS